MSLNKNGRLRPLRVLRSLFLGRVSGRIRCLVDVMQHARSRGYFLRARLCSRWLERYGVYVSNRAVIGDGLRLPHPTSIVIGAGVRIGSNVTIYQSVTCGGRVVGDWEQGNYPEISDGCVIFSGSAIIGKVKVGRNCVIGANSVVLSDIPDNAVAVGAPARVVKLLETK
ncbi:serine O-acetyltransferase [Rhodobacter sp. NSM]|uniref:serine O-acetyltransferase n=1 Tax=Rhodobacter sp. NSM TaxID=3457501 RepID=UPI003FD47280